MLIIRKEQMEVFRANMRKSFENEALDYARENFPGDCDVLGEAQTRIVIDLGIDRAAEHGFDTKGDVCDYIMLMFALGSYFDEDPQLPWTAEILEDSSLLSPSDMMEKLYAEASDYLKKVSGDNGVYYKKALLRARKMSYASLEKSISGNLTQDIDTILISLYPQQYHILTESSRNSLTDLGRSSAESYGLKTREGILIYIMLMFMLGSSFDRDPLHPWAEDVLQGDSLYPVVKARRLYEAIIVRLDQALDNNRSTRGS